MKTYRVGLLGFGFIGKVHAYGHLNLPLFYDPLPFRTEIVKVCTAHSATAKCAAERLGGAAQGITDFREITEDPTIDIVDICSPNDEHVPAALSAIAHGKHIFCEKPLAGNWSQAQQLADALTSYQSIAQMTLIYRFYPPMMHAIELAHEGFLGEVLEFRAHYLHSGNVNPETPMSFKLAAGTVADLGSHILDLTEAVTGPFASIQARTHIAYPTRPKVGSHDVYVPVTAEDNMNCLVTLANGAVGTVSASKIALGTEDGIYLEVHGTKGALRLEPMNLQQLFIYDGQAPVGPYGGRRGWTAVDCGQRYPKPAGFPTPKAVLGWLRGHVHCLYHFLNGVYTGTPVHPDLADGVHVQRLMEAVYESARQSGKAVPLGKFQPKVTAANNSCPE